MARTAAACPHLQLGGSCSTAEERRTPRPGARHQPALLGGSPCESPRKFHCLAAEGEPGTWESKEVGVGQGPRDPWALLGCKALSATHQGESISQQGGGGAEAAPWGGIAMTPSTAPQEGAAPSPAGTTAHSEPPWGRHGAHPPSRADMRQCHLCCCHCLTAGTEGTPIPALLFHASPLCATRTFQNTFSFHEVKAKYQPSPERQLI